MGDSGRTWRPSGSGPSERAAGEDPRFTGNSVAADREWAQNRIANFLRAQKGPIQRKAEPGADAAAAPVSKPSDAAEQEADQTSDAVAEQLHGGDKADGAHAPAGPKHAPAPIAAKLESGTVSLAKKDDKKEAKKPECRGRLQVQGEDLGQELSWPWARAEPPKADEAVAELGKLKGQLTKKQLEIRSEAFESASRFITNAKANGGVDAPVSQTYQNKNLRDKEKTARVDIEVRTGKAFV